jgi:FkbM family methyltransferase
MLRVLKDCLKPIYLFLKERNYREYARLVSKYGNAKRYKPAKIKFLNYQIEVIDVLSFVYQFKEIFYEGSFKISLKKADPVIYDCGANIGISCLYFKKLYPQSRIKAFEADPDIFKVLKSNLVLNNQESNVEFNNLAIWTHNNGVSFNQEGSDGGFIVDHNDPRVEQVKIPSVRLKDLLEQEPHIDFLKIDIEGAEVDVLIDCDGSFKNVDYIFFEYHSFSKERQKLDDVLRILTKNGFRYFIQSPYLRPSPFAIRNDNLTMDMQLNVYCFK